MTISPVTDEHTAALVDFFLALPEEDRTFIQEDVGDPDAVRSLLATRVQQWVAVDDAGRIGGYVAVKSRPGWSDHVGDIRLVVDPAHRRTGVGRELARHALAAAITDGRRKIVVELTADQEHAVAMFATLGFTGEALLRDHIRDRNGHLRDMLMLAHFVDDSWGSMETLGLAEELGD
ncbi:GNAT family N-acetyltransferase [Gordonia sp. TBRC 11910]|uniref:GNAT family N-acetyltransferase n=1 Tax=Gordonia asplenii TaxID=2725283 RepID=A0A848KVK7_9ACTN|nr:GNAT family N-acetyltransferase [Gordonia asplenii]NMO00905.1 GNAT family N-acetyltransferase [Gordonia asplenii]